VQQLPVEIVTHRADLSGFYSRQQRAIGFVDMMAVIKAAKS
jgi:hypothetical protein